MRRIFAGCLLFPLLACQTALAQTQQRTGDKGQGTENKTLSELRLSVTDALRLAKAQNPLGRSAAAKAAGANARLDNARSFANPLLSLAQPFGQNTGGLDEGTVITQTFELGDKMRQRVRAARSERDATLADRAGTFTDLTLNTQTAYYEALRAEAEYTLAATALANAQEFAKAADIQFRVGDVARSNVVRSRIELTRAEQALLALETERANRYATLRSLLLLPEETKLVLTDTLDAFPKTYALSNLQTLAAQQRPDLRSARNLRDAREASLHGARVQNQPDFFIEARRSTLDPTVGGNSLRIGIVFPLLDLGRNRADARAAQAALLDQTALVDETTRVARLEVETASRNLELARQTVESFRAGRLDRSKELLDMTQLGYSKGANSYLELLDAQQIFRTEQTEYARALAAYQIALATLQRAVGGTLP